MRGAAPDAAAGAGHDAGLPGEQARRERPIDRACGDGLPSKCLVSIVQCNMLRQAKAPGTAKRMLYTEQHRELMRSVTKFVEAEIDPHAEEWEEAGIFPAHELFRKMGEQGLLGIHKPEKFGGQGLDYSYEIAFCEALGAAKSASAVMAHRRADRHGDAGADAARLGRTARGIPQAQHRGRVRRLPRRVGSRRRLRRRLDQDHARRRTAATTSSTAARCGPPTARRPTGCACLPTPATARSIATSR